MIHINILLSGDCVIADFDPQSIQIIIYLNVFSLLLPGCRIAVRHDTHKINLKSIKHTVFVVDPLVYWHVATKVPPVDFATCMCYSYNDFNRGQAVGVGFSPHLFY